MRFAVLFVDDERHADQRRVHMARHLAFLERHADAIVAAGPLSDSRDGTGAGGLWIVEADEPKSVRTLVEEDPFWPTGLRQSVRILAWRQVFADGVRLV